MNNFTKSKRLVEYSSDEELNSEEDDCSASSSSVFNNTGDSLPVPIEIQDMYRDSTITKAEAPPVHGGNIRTFPHERGVWATYIYIQYDPSSEFFDMVKKFQIVSKKHGIDLEVLENFHVSLSRTVKLRHHWIQPFIDSLKMHLSPIYIFKLMFCSLEVYENEERTRTFLGLKVNTGFEHLIMLTKKVDLCLKDFQLPCFYNNPSFHMSCASCVGSKAEIIESFLADLDVLFQSFIDRNPSCRSICVTELCCKSGNKLYTINLKS